MSKAYNSNYLVPFIEKAILEDKHRLLVILILSVSPRLKKEIMDRLSKDHVKR